MFCYVYFGLYQPGRLQGMLQGDGPIGPTSQATLAAVSILMVVPSLLPPTFNRWTNIVLALLYAVIVGLTMPGSWRFTFFLRGRNRAELAHRVVCMKLAQG
jgi:O-antigen ligase